MCPGATWMVLIGECHMTSSWYSKHVLGMTITTVRISNFPLQIWNILRKCVQGQHEWSWLENVTWLLLVFQTCFGYNNCSGENIWSLSSDLESPQKKGPGGIWMVPIREHHLTCSLCILDIAYAIDGMRCFHLQIWNLMKNRSECRLNHPIWRRSTFQTDLFGWVFWVFLPNEESYCLRITAYFIVSNRCIWWYPNNTFWTTSHIPQNHPPSS